MLMTYDASVEVMNKQKLFSAEHTVRDSALQTQQKQWVKRAKFFFGFKHEIFIHSAVQVRFWWQAGS